jgi:hypothetical protein
MKSAFHTASQSETPRLRRDADVCALRDGNDMPGPLKDNDTHHD